LDCHPWLWSDTRSCFPRNVLHPEKTCFLSSRPPRFLNNSTGSTSNFINSLYPESNLYRIAGICGIHRRPRVLCEYRGAESAHVLDRACCFWKNSRTVTLINFLQCALIATDYKLNFTPGKSDHISALHERVGDRLLNLFSSNGGLYIKFGVFHILATGLDVPTHT